MRARVKWAVEATLVAGGLTRLARRRHRFDTLVLAYHNIVPPELTGLGDSSLHMSLRAFERQLDSLQAHFDVIELKSVPDTGAGDRPKVAITFDDAYRGALTLGVTALAERGLPATFFIPPGLLGSTAYWWDTFANPTAGAVEDALRQLAITELAGQTAKVSEHAASTGLQARTMPAELQIVSEEELLEVESYPGMAVASHSWSHPNLCALHGESLAEELERPLEWLRLRFDSLVAWLSYPYGLFNPQVAEAAASVGYIGALRIEGGWVARDHLDMFATPRANIPAGVSTPGFALRAAGLSCR